MPIKQELTTARATGALPAVQSVERAARMLRLFSVDEPQLTLGDLTARMEMSKATAHRYATALRNVGLLRLHDGVYAYTELGFVETERSSPSMT